MSKIKPYQKEFKYTIRNAKGDITNQEIVVFGSEDYPFPENWQEDGMAQMSLLEYKDELLLKYNTVEISEDTTMDIDGSEVVYQLMRKLMDDKRLIDKATPIDGKKIKMDLSDIGNAVGQIIQQAINANEGDYDDFLNGLQHGMQQYQI